MDLKKKLRDILYKKLRDKQRQEQYGTHRYFVLSKALNRLDPSWNYLVERRAAPRRSRQDIMRDWVACARRYERKHGVHHWNVLWRVGGDLPHGFAALLWEDWNKREEQHRGA